MFEVFIHDCHQGHFNEAGESAVQKLALNEDKLNSLFAEHGISYIQIEPAPTLFPKETSPYSLLFSLKKQDDTAIHPRVLSHIESELSRLAESTVCVGPLAHRTQVVPLRKWKTQNEIWDDVLQHDIAHSDAAIKDLHAAETYHDMLSQASHAVPDTTFVSMQRDARAMHLIESGEAVHNAFQHIPKEILHEKAPATKTLVYLRNYLAHPEQFDGGCEALLSSDHDMSYLIKEARAEMAELAQMPELAVHLPKLNQARQTLEELETRGHTMEGAIRFRELRAGRFLGEVTEYLKHMDLPGLGKKLYSFTGHANDIAHGRYNAPLAAHSLSHAGILEQVQQQLKHECYGITPAMREFGATPVEFPYVGLRAACQGTRKAEFISGLDRHDYAAEAITQLLENPTLPQRTGRAVQRMRGKLVEFAGKIQKAIAHGILGETEQLTAMGLDPKEAQGLASYLGKIPRSPELIEWAAAIKNGQAQASVVAGIAIGPNKAQRSEVINEILATFLDEAIGTKRKLKSVLQQLEVPDVATLREEGLKAAEILQREFHPPQAEISGRAAEIVRSTLQRIGHCPEGLSHFLEGAEGIAARAVTVASKAMKR
ncbi:MAG: hypothetical protein U1E36_06990 [Rickettsiales bacterium]